MAVSARQEILGARGPGRQHPLWRSQEMLIPQALFYLP